MADDIKRSKRNTLSPKPLLLNTGLLEGEEGIITINNISLETKLTKGCPQGSCCGPGLWNIHFDSLLKLQYTKHTKVVAFADDLLIMIKA